uniref:Uncharacterized protein n=1 Tax=Anguilla anguilla TaxID=7936 RepID=A0A0E9QC51_ANGAN
MDNSKGSVTRAHNKYIILYTIITCHYPDRYRAM